MQDPDEYTIPGAPSPGAGRARFWILWSVVFAAVVAALWALLPAVLRAGFGKSPAIVIYCAQDQAFAEPALKYFQRSRGVRVQAVYDSEAVKTVGLANRLLAEQANPQCDLFWGNEELRTRQLARRGVFETNGWVAFGYRTRRIVVNTNLLAGAPPPGSLLELTNSAWRGKVAFAYPQFGTTATHFHALRQLWGEALWESWCRGLAANQSLMTDGNSGVVDLVGKGVAVIGLTDSDDIATGQKNGYPVEALPITPETLLIPNTLALVRGAPSRGRAILLAEHLQSPLVLHGLLTAGALEGLSPNDIQSPVLQPDWEHLLDDLDKTTARLNAIFLR